METAARREAQVLEQAQIIDAEMALALQRDACRDHALVGWVVWREHPAHPEHRFVAQLATGTALPYILVGDTLAEVQEQLPAGLVRHSREPADPPEVLELWVAP